MLLTDKGVIVLQVIALLLCPAIHTDKVDGYYATLLCGEGKWRCPESNRCISVTKYCDGQQDCHANEDELGCNCARGTEPCMGDSQCIPREQWCDGTPHCDNASDEKPNCCKMGFHRNTAMSPCEDTDECRRQDGACSQHCNNTEGSYTCSCDDGYVLEEKPDKPDLARRRSMTMSYCRAIGQMNVIITVTNAPPQYFSYTDDERAGPFTSIPIAGEYRPEDNIMVDIDFDYRNHKMLWCSTNNNLTPASYRRDIWVADLAEDLASIKNSRPIVRNVNCDSIAVDWINQLLYFTSDTHTIEVVDYEGQERRAIIWTGLRKPRAIDVDPASGLLFYTDWGKDAHLGRANMDGSDRRQLINNTDLQQIVWPNALTLDYPNKNVYWIDSNIKSIECMAYDGKSRYTIMQGNTNLGHPWRMQLFQDRVYWRDIDRNAGGAISSANKFTGGGYEKTRAENSGGQESGGGWGLRIYHPVIQPESPSRCSHGLCQKLCLPIPGGYRCACPTGHKLMYDARTCTSLIEQYAFVAMKNMIVKMALAPLEPTPQLIRFERDKYQESMFWSLDYHMGVLYYNSISTDTSQLSINRMLYDGSESKVIVNEKSNGGLSVDWLNHKIYWASVQTVSVGELDGSVHTTLLQREEFEFRDILVDPCNGYIYLAAWGDTQQPGGIYRCSMDGDSDSFTEIISFAEFTVRQPTGLTLDRDSDSLFFANEKTLYRVSLNRSPLTAEPIITRSESAKIVSADIWGDKIVWTERSADTDDGNRIMAMGKLGNSSNSPIEPEPIREFLSQEPFGIKVHPRRNNDCAAQNPCLDHACSHMCLQSSISHGVKGYKCVCPTGYALKANSTTECADEIAQYLVYNPQHGIQTVSLDTNFLTPIKEPRNMEFKVTVFDLHARNNSVYYCYNNPNKFEVRKLFDDSVEPQTLPIHTIQCSGMAVEWVTEKLYIVDKGNSPESGLILVIDLKRPYLMRHIVTGLREPLDLVVHPAKGKIYCILASYNIMSTTMDGADMSNWGNFETIVSSDPSTNRIQDDPGTQLFLDYDSDSLYWTENIDEAGVGYVGLIKKVKLSTKRVVTVFRKAQVTLAGVTLINGDLYYTTHRGVLYRLNGDKGTYLLQASENSLFLRSSNAQYNVLDNPCAVDNGGCSDFCLLDVGGRVKCSCPTGIELKDTLNCDTPFNKTVLVVANETRISMISLANSDKAIDRVLTGKPRNLRSIDVDIRENKIYWSEIHDGGSTAGAIMLLDMTTGATEKIVWEDILVPNSIAVDWNAQNLYWVDSGSLGKGTLEILSLRTRKRAVLKKHDVGGNVRPHQVVIDPIEKILFVSYPVPDVDEVVTGMWLDGSNQYGIRDDYATHTKKPTQILNDLAIDIMYKKLYWSSSDSLHHISTCDYAGGKRDVINGIPMNNIQSIGILNKNVFVQNTEFDSPKTQIRVYDNRRSNEERSKLPLLHTYTFQHLKGTIVSMKVSSIAVLQETSISCRPNMCPDMICIPNPIEVACKCADEDTECQKLNEMQTEVVTNYIPGYGSRCPENYCNSHGQCIQYTDKDNNTIESSCNCDEGYQQPRCRKKKGDHIVPSTWITVPIIIVAIIIVVVILWCNPKLCHPNKADRLRDGSSDGDDTETDQLQREPQAEHLHRFGKKGIGQSYTQVNNHNRAEQHV